MGGEGERKRAGSDPAAARQVEQDKGAAGAQPAPGATPPVSSTEAAQAQVAPAAQAQLAEQQLALQAERAAHQHAESQAMREYMTFMRSLEDMCTDENFGGRDSDEAKQAGRDLAQHTARLDALRARGAELAAREKELAKKEKELQAQQGGGRPAP